MKKLLLALSLVPLLVPAAASAQPFPVNGAGVTNGHWHLNSRDIEANKKIFVAMGGTLVPAGNFQIVRFPGVLVYLNQGPGAAPANGGTVGSVVNHVGFTVPNVQESIAKWKAAGVNVLPGGPGRTDQAFVETPDGVRIEILENKDQKFPIQSQHVHFNIPESEIPKIQAWYSAWFESAFLSQSTDRMTVTAVASRMSRAADVPRVSTTANCGAPSVGTSAGMTRWDDPAPGMMPTTASAARSAAMNAVVGGNGRGPERLPAESSIAAMAPAARIRSGSENRKSVISPPPGGRGS